MTQEFDSTQRKPHALLASYQFWHFGPLKLCCILPMDRVPTAIGELSPYDPLESYVSLIIAYERVRIT